MALPFAQILQALRSAGVTEPAEEILRQGDEFWWSLNRETRHRTLASVGLGDMHPDRVVLRIARSSESPDDVEAATVRFEPGELPTALDHPARSMPRSSGDEQLVPAPGAQPARDMTPAREAQPPRPRPEPLGLAPSQPLPQEASPRADLPASAPSATPKELVPTSDHATPSSPAEANASGLPQPANPPAKPAEAAQAQPPAEAPPAKKGLGSLFKRKAKTEPDAASEPEPAVDLTQVTQIKPLAENLDLVEVYAVQEPYAYIRIFYDKARHEYVYEVLEPELTDRERNILEFLEDTLIDIIEMGLSAFTPQEAAKQLRKHIDDITYDYSINLAPISKEKIMYYVLRDFLGFGKLDPMMRDELIEDISCDGPGVPIFLYHRKYESLRSTVQFKEHDEANSFVIRMAQRSGKHISVAEPLLDATLPDGSRLNATLSDEVTANGSTFTIRKFRDDPFTITDLIRYGTMNPDILAYWWMAVQNGASAIYAGGTASGKTTSLNAILLFIPPQMKIVSIEDTREINLPHENWIAGVTRSGFGPRDNHGRQAGEIDMFTLLKAALRQRPEYILVGEVRGQEAYALFQAMATGHTAYGTMHADSAEAVIHRLESEPISIPRSLLEALDIVSIQIQTRIGGKRVRRTKELIEIVGLDPHTREILTNEVFSWNPATDTFEFSGMSYVLERIMVERNMTEHEMREEMARRKEIIQYLVRKSIRDYRDVGKLIVSYYKQPQETMDRIRAEMREMDEAEAEAARSAAEAEAAAPLAGGAGAAYASQAPAQPDVSVPDDPALPADDTPALTEGQSTEES